MHTACERGYALRSPRPGEAVQDPEEVLAATLATIAAAMRELNWGVSAIALSSAMHSLVGLDDHARPLTPLLTWADTRALEQAERVRESDPALHLETGTPIHPMSPLLKLIWFREMQPALFTRVRRWAGIKELVVHRLCGEWMIDESCASGTGLMSLSDRDWDATALGLCGLGSAQLSSIVPCTTVLPVRRHNGAGLRAGTPLVIGAGDGPAANLGVGAIAPGIAACSIGTSGALRLAVERPVVDPTRTMFCYALTAGRWVVGGAINNGGSVLEWAASALAPELGPRPQPALLELAAQAPAGSDGLLMLPYLHGERAPHWDARVQGAYIGLRAVHGRGHLIRAALEGVCQQLALVLEAMRSAGEEVHQVRATGGFARSAVWRQMLSDVLGMAIDFPAGHQGSAFGAALLGFVACGSLTSIDAAAQLVAVDQTVWPDRDAAELYASLRPRLRELLDEHASAFRG